MCRIDEEFRINLQDIDDVDKENMHDPVQVALYAWDIFQYYKDREVQLCRNTHLDYSRHQASLQMDFY